MHRSDLSRIQRSRHGFWSDATDISIAARLPEQIVVRCCDILKAELRHKMRAMTDGVDRTFEYKTGYPSFHRNDGDRRVGRGVRITFD
jgi:hypothetical protein